MRHLHLLVADLPAPAAPDRLPALSALLARGRPLEGAQPSLTAALCRAFGLAADCPVAPLTLALDGMDPGDAYWLRADPVHLSVHIDKLVLNDSRLLRLAPEEARRIAADLSAHFAGDGLEFLALAPGRWYLRLPEPPRLVTAPLDAVAGRAIDGFLPRGEAARAWRSRFNEIQMLLHAHPANAEREARGELAVNSVWFWGGGVLPDMPDPTYGRVCGDTVTARALARAAGLPAEAEPGGFSALAGRGADALVVLDELPTPARYEDQSACDAILQAYESRWLAPALSALQRGRLRKLTLEGTGAHPVKVQLTSMDAWRLWRRR